MPDTNIKEHHKEAFEALTSGKYDNFGLFSCFVNGEPACALVATTRHDGEPGIVPLFVSITPSMVLTDHDGVSPRKVRVD